VYSEMSSKANRKRPRADQVHAWAALRGIPLTKLWRELFPKKDVGYSHFLNVLNGHRSKGKGSEQVFRKVTRRLTPDIARQLGIPQHLVRQVLFPEK